MSSLDTGSSWLDTSSSMRPMRTALRADMKDGTIERYVGSGRLMSTWRPVTPARKWVKRVARDLREVCTEDDACRHEVAAPWLRASVFSGGPWYLHTGGHHGERGLGWCVLSLGPRCSARHSLYAI